MEHGLHLVTKDRRIRSHWHARLVAIW